MQQESETLFFYMNCYITVFLPHKSFVIPRTENFSESFIQTSSATKKLR